jgi:hypothetical protein
MDTPPVNPSRAPIPRKVAVGLVIGWALIAVKCALTPYVMTRWHVPVAPVWVIGPTLVFALLVSALVIFRDWSVDEA